MSKCLALGMPLADVVRAATVSPAETIGFADRIGTLGVGRCADIAVLELRDVDMEMEDSQSQMRRVKQLLLPNACWRAGERVDGVSNVLETPAFPNPLSLASQAEAWEKLEVRDPTPPPYVARGGVTTSGAAAHSVFASLACAAAPATRDEALQEQWPGGPLMPKNRFCC